MNAAADPDTLGGQTENKCLLPPVPRSVARVGLIAGGVSDKLRSAAKR